MQAGVAPTQLQHFTLEGKETKQFYEVFAPLDTDPAVSLGQDYVSSLKAAYDSFSDTVKPNDFATFTDFMASYTNTAPSKVLWHGGPW